MKAIQKDWQNKGRTIGILLLFFYQLSILGLYQLGLGTSYGQKGQSTSISLWCWTSENNDDSTKRLVVIDH